LSNVVLPQPGRPVSKTLWLASNNRITNPAPADE
jgi:hypothetical protein